MAVNKVEVCLLPELVRPEMVTGKVVVVIDVFRASSAIITGLAHSVDHFLAVTDPLEAKKYQHQGYLAAGERGGEQLPGFDLGNSPFDYAPEKVKGKRVVITTSNGTRAIAAAQGARAIFTASFLNISAMLNYLNQQDEDVLLLCSGWHGALSMEDTVFAGALLEGMEGFSGDSDECFLAEYIHNKHQDHLLDFMKQGAHAQRLIKLGFEEDVAFCLQKDKYDFLAEIIDFRIKKVESKVLKKS